MKTFSTLILATLAVAAFLAESADAVQVHAHHNQPVMKKVDLAKKQQQQHVAKLVASDLDENDGDVLSDPFADGPIGGVMGFDDEEPPATKGPLFTDSNSGSGEDEDGSSLDDGSGTNEDGSTGSDDGSANNEDGSADSNDGSADNEDGSADDGSADDNGDGSGESDGDDTKPPTSKASEEAVTVNEWSLFDLESSAVGDEGSGGSQDADELSSSSGSNAEDTEGSGSNGSGSNELGPEESIGNPQGVDAEPGNNGGWGDVTGAGETKEAREAKLHHEQKAAVELAARASADGSVAAFGLKGVKPMLLAGSAIGAAVGALAAVMGVVHLRRQQQRDEQSTLASELPEPQTGREDFEASANAEAGDDALASSSIDLEEALTRADEESSESEEDAEEGAFANGSTVV